METKKIHNIIASTILSDAIRHIRFEYLTMVRGYLRPKDKDQKLFVKMEHAARQSMEVVLSERDMANRCPHCQKEINPNSGSFLSQGKLFHDKDGNLYQDVPFKCPHCGEIVHLVTKTIGVYRSDETERFKENETTSPFRPQTVR